MSKVHKVTHISWQDLFEIELAEAWGKSKGKAKILVLHENDEREMEEEKSCTKLGDCEVDILTVQWEGDRSCMETIVSRKLKQFAPTHVVVGVRDHGIDIIPGAYSTVTLHSDPSKGGITHDIRHVINKTIVPHINDQTSNIFINQNYFVFETMDILIKENFVLFSPVVITGGIDDLIRYLKGGNNENDGAKEIIKNHESTRILILSGTHGDHAGESALSDKNYLESNFFDDDVKELGNAVKKTPEVDRMVFKVLNMAHYSPHPPNDCQQAAAELVKDVKLFKPTFIALMWCYSMFGDVAMLLRSDALFAELALLCDLRKITSNADACLSEEQTDFIRRINERENDGEYRFHRIFIEGTSGSGKTLCAVEVLKQRVAHLRKDEPCEQINVLVVLPNQALSRLSRYDDTPGKSDYGHLGDDFYNKYMTDVKRMSNVNLQFTHFDNDRINELPDQFTPDVILVDEMRISRRNDENDWSGCFVGEVNEDTGTFEYDVSEYSLPNISIKPNQTFVFCINPNQVRPDRKALPHKMKHQKTNDILTVSLSKGYRNSETIERFINVMRSRTATDRTDSYVGVEEGGVGERFYPTPLFKKKEEDVVHVYVCDSYNDYCLVESVKCALMDIGTILRNNEKCGDSGYNTGFFIRDYHPLKLYDQSYDQMLLGFYYKLVHFHDPIHVHDALEILFGEDKKEKEKWGKLEHIDSFRGAEADVVIMILSAGHRYGRDFNAWEGWSRARKQLFIIDTEGLFDWNGVKECAHDILNVHDISRSHKY